MEAPKEPSFEQRRTAENLRDSVLFQCEDIGRRSARFSPQQGMFMDYLMDTLVANRFDAELFEYQVDGTAYHSVIGRRSGTGSGTLLIGTHYDTYSKSPGANASASGVVASAEAGPRARGVSVVVAAAVPRLRRRRGSTRWSRAPSAEKRSTRRSGRTRATR